MCDGTGAGRTLGMLEFMSHVTLLCPVPLHVRIILTATGEETTARRQEQAGQKSGMAKVETPSRPNNVLQVEVIELRQVLISGY